MRASILDLRRRMAGVLKALDRGERVTILHRGKERAVLVPSRKARARPAAEHPVFGMWKGRKDMKDPTAFVRLLRKARGDAL